MKCIEKEVVLISKTNFFKLNFPEITTSFFPLTTKIRLIIATVPAIPEITISRINRNQEKKGFIVPKQSPPVLARYSARMKKKIGPAPIRTHFKLPKISLELFTWLVLMFLQ
jgi:hypothetical protein